MFLSFFNQRALVFVFVFFFPAALVYQLSFSTGGKYILNVQLQIYLLIFLASFAVCENMHKCFSVLSGCIF